MKERPILFSAPMVRAILEGRKTQTRRVVKRCGLWETTGGQGMRPMPEACPYGQPGDRLWVRETLTASHLGLEYAADRARVEHAEADALNERYARTPPFELETRAVPSIHMPRWASRITLELTDVRVQRLQDISEAESRAEGIIQYEDEIGYGTGYPDTDPNLAGTGVGAFRKLWESINGADAWDDNPWVWVVSFRQVQP